MTLTAGSNRSTTRTGYEARTPRGAALAAVGLAWLVAGLALAASLIGLVVDGVYGPVASTAEMFRANDLVTAVVVVPGLVSAGYFARRGSAMGGLVVVGLEAALVYTYAYYLFGTGFNDLFLLHVAIFAAGLAALVLSLATLDVAAVAERFGPRTPVRAIAVLLGGLAVALGGMWVYLAVDNAITGDVPAGSRLVETVAVVRLGMVLDLALLVPLYAVAAVLLWRRAPWGYALTAIALVGGLVHQVGYLVAMPFQVAADIPGAVLYDPGEPVVVLVYLVATALLLRGARAGRAA
jgi:hypothetical protein